MKVPLLGACFRVLAAGEGTRTLGPGGGCTYKEALQRCEQGAVPRAGDTRGAAGLLGRGGRGRFLGQKEGGREATSRGDVTFGLGTALRGESWQGDLTPIVFPSSPTRAPY